MKAARAASMTEKYLFAAVDLPFHVWVKEGTRWVLREAASHLREGSAPVGTSASLAASAGGEAG
jgi:hypothetical protein